LAAWPLFELMQAGSLVAATLGQVLFIAMLAIPLGSAPAIFVELFPPVDRLTGYSISYNLGVGVIGGATPMAATWLIQQTGNSLSVAGMLVVAGALGVLAMLWIDDSSREDICQPAGQKCPVQC
jgi:MHS family proline/betaine transporter-like MFS transporter